MKRLLWVIGVLLLSQNWAAAQRHHDISGRWYSPYLDRMIRIGSDRGGIKVRGLFYRNKWVKFQYAGRDEFFCGNGDRIIRVSRDRVVFSSANRRTRITLIPWEYRHDRYEHGRTGWRPGRPSDRDISDDFGRDDDRYFEPEDYAGRDNDYGDPDGGHDGYLDLEGTWMAEGLGRKVYIVDTRDGLKARLQDDSRWYKYFQAKGNSGEYISDDGQKYRWVGQNKLEWSDKSGNKRLVLNRLSGQLE